MQTLLQKHWHHLPVEQVVELLGTDPETGLERAEAAERQSRFGPNAVTPARGRPAWQRFLLQFYNPLVMILLASAFITAWLKDWIDAVIIFGVVLVNALIGYLQEANAEKAIGALARTLKTEAEVIRSGEPRRVPAEELVPGDLVSLASGDRVPADVRLLATRELQAGEAALTGESLPVLKAGGQALPAETPLAERTNMAYAGSLITSGQGRGVVVATGDFTELGRISRLIATADEISTPLTRAIARFSRWVLGAILTLAAVAFFIGVLRGQAVVDTLMAAIALAVAMIPEGLPAALTVTLAIGVARMARRLAIIRRLPAVEALGSVTVICSDKTGTLTRNEMTVRQVYIPGAYTSFEGVGYVPDGRVLQGNAPLDRADSALQELLTVGVLCNDSRLLSRDGFWSIEGDPTEAALLVAARKAGLDPEGLRRSYLRLDAIPFDSQHQYMAVLYRDSEGETGGQIPRIAVKGAVESILPFCSKALDHTGEFIPIDPGAVRQAAESMANTGLRVLAFAAVDGEPGQQQITPAHLEKGLTFLGLQGMIDPPRPEVIAALETTRSAGVEVKMITGDHPFTAAAIARQIGLPVPADGTGVYTGQDLAGLSDEAFIEVAARASVFARVSPEQKLRLVRALQAGGHVVAMTGDGVNDGPALKQADVGVAMGVAGTDVARETADMVLADDNFATIAAAVEEGRAVYDNLTRIIAWTLPTNIGQGLVILLALLLGTVLPILPVQVLWINLISVGVLGLVLALEPRERGLMQRPPRDPAAPVLSPGLLIRTVLVGFFILAAAFGIFEWELAIGGSLAEARTAAVNAVIVVGVFYLLNCRSLQGPALGAGLFTNPWLLVGIGVMAILQAAFTYLPFMNQVLYSAPLDGQAWLRIFAAGLLTFLAVELEKWLRRSAGRPPQRLASTQEVS